MNFPTGTISQSLDVQIVDDSGLPVTGLVAATFPATSWSLAGNTAATAITLSDLALITTAYTSGGVKERSGGYYRLDLPNAALANAGVVTLIGEASGKRLVHPRVQVGATVTAGSVTGNVAGNVTGSVGSIAAGGINAASIATDAIDADALAADAVTEIQSGLSTLNAAGVRTAVGLASANLDTQLTAVPTANANADALLDRAAGVETGLTVRQWLRLGAAVLFGKSTGGGKTYRDFADSKDRIAATIDGSNNRTAVTRDAS
jgi:hypothetical protein